MRINLVGWSSHGLRCPDVEVNLRLDAAGPAHVALVQMPNGTGKTTTLELLNATLSGEATNWDETKVRSYRRAGDDRDRGSFVVNLLVDERPLTLELTLDFETGAASYRTTNPGSGGVVHSWAPPPNLRRFLSPEFLSLFIFDGEFAERLFDPMRAEAENAIDALCQLYMLDSVANFADDEWTRRSRQASGRSDAMLQRLRQQRTALLARQDKIKRAKVAAEQKIAVAKIEIADLERRVEERLTTVESTQAKYTEARLAVERTGGELATATGNLMQAMRQPLAVNPVFSPWLVDLKESLDNLRLPENTSAQFFEELLQEPECICGREMTDGARQEIRTRAKGYLDADESGVINAMKKDIGDLTAATETRTPNEELQELRRKLNEAKREHKLAKQTVDALQEKLISEGDEELKAWRKSLDEHKALLLEYSQLVQRIDGDGEDERDEELWSLKLIDRRIKEAEKRIAEITETVTLRRQTDVVKRIVQRTKELARARIKEELTAASNERLRSVLSNDPITIAGIDRSLRLAQGGASVGQTLSAGYVFLMSALHRGNNDFPLVVDSPANPMDAGRRRRVGALIPELCSQFVGFTINTEHLGFVPALEETAESIKFMTMFRKTDGTARLIDDLPSAGVQQTDNAVLITDREYFMGFDMTDEGD